eukprot:2655161-Pleurochrysis_carterae.AAC.1
MSARLRLEVGIHHLSSYPRSVSGVRKIPQGGVSTKRSMMRIRGKKGMADLATAAAVPTSARRRTCRVRGGARAPQ